VAHFYLTDALDAAPGATAEITGAEARHAVTVSRITVGEHLRVGDGRGTVVVGTVESAEPARLTIRVDQVEHHERRRPALTLAQALAKGDRDELAVQAATELGVDAVIPWEAARSVVRWEGAKRAKGRDRWAAIVHEATKQSLRPWRPEVRDVMTTPQLLAHAGDARILVLDPVAEASIAEIDSDGRDIVLVVGPEGGMTSAELATFEAAGAQRVHLGPEVLRTSTAGPAAIAVLSVRFGRWGGSAPRG
jgi:16S rRNA (uracil1498-N3)-methyltransferase